MNRKFEVTMVSCILLFVCACNGTTSLAEKNSNIKAASTTETFDNATQSLTLSDDVLTFCEKYQISLSETSFICEFLLSNSELETNISSIPSAKDNYDTSKEANDLHDNTIAISLSEAESYLSEEDISIIEHFLPNGTDKNIEITETGFFVKGNNQETLVEIQKSVLLEQESSYFYFEQEFSNPVTLAVLEDINNTATALVLEFSNGSQTQYIFSNDNCSLYQITLNNNKNF